MKTTTAYIVDLQDIDKTMLSMVGGKAANLGELSSIANVQVPAGFCVTKEAYKDIIARCAGLNDLLDELAALEPGNRKGISVHGTEGYVEIL